MRSSGGRPRAADAALLGERIVTAAATLFLRQGYAATSIEAIAAAAGVSKRTLYARFDGKGAVFLAVVRRLIRDWLATTDDSAMLAAGLDDALLATARQMLAVALRPEALALHALVMAEVMRFPEMAAALREGGGNVGVQRVTGLLLARAPHLTPTQAAFAAEQFQHLVVSGPQRRAMGLGTPLDLAAREQWCQDCVALFLRGLPGA